MSGLLAFTLFHTAISLVALGLGVGVIAGMFFTGWSRRWTSGFLVMAVATSVTSFMFPFKGVTPAIITGIVALAVLAMVLVANHSFHLAGAWRWVYASGMVLSVYLLAFVGVVQAFQKVPFLNAVAPTQTELPFAIVQIATLIAFVVLAVMAAIKFKVVVEVMAQGQPVH